MVILVGAPQPDYWQYRLGSIYFNTRNEPDADGCLWTMPEPDGWESPAVRVNAVDIPYGDGQDLGDVYFQARTIHASGEIICTRPGDSDAIDRAKSRLLRETSLLRRDGQFVGRDGTGTWYANCRRGDRTAFPSRPGPEASTFDFVLIAGDPYKYAVDATVVQVDSANPLPGGLISPWRSPLIASTDADVASATDTSVNNGDTDAALLLDFVGPLTNPKLIDRMTGHRIELNADIPTGRKITVDTRNRTVMEDVTSVYGVVSPRSTPLDQLLIPAGGSCAWVLIGAGTGHVLVTHRDTKE